MNEMYIGLGIVLLISVWAMIANMESVVPVIGAILLWGIIGLAIYSSWVEWRREKDDE